MQAALDQGKQRASENLDDHVLCPSNDSVTLGERLRLSIDSLMRSRLLLRIERWLLFKQFNDCATREKRCAGLLNGDEHGWPTMEKLCLQK